MSHIIQEPRQFGRDISNLHFKSNTNVPSKQNLQPTKTVAKKIVQVAQPLKVNKAPAPLLPTHIENEYSTDSEYSEDAESMMIDNNNLSLEDIDQYDHSDPQFVAEYINDIMAFLKEKEIAQQTIIPSNYCEFQTDFKPRHRDQLVRWMSEVYVQLKLFPETYFLAVNIVDQVLAKGVVPRKKLHIIGVTALFVASKYEETWAPPLNDFRICCDNAFTEDEILAMERLILNRIDFNLSVPYPLPFLRRYSKAASSDALSHTISKYIIELTCQSYAMLQFLPSQIAAAAVLITRQVRNTLPLWNSNTRYYSGYEKEDLVECAHAIIRLMKKEHQRAGGSAVVKKYSEKKFMCVAIIVQEAFSK